MLIYENAPVGSREQVFNRFYSRLIELERGSQGRDTGNLHLTHHFLKKQQSQFMGVANQSYYLRALVNLLQFRNKAFKEFTKQDFEDFMAFISAKWSQGTIYRLVTALKAFFK